MSRLPSQLLPPNEAARLAALEEYGILDTPRELAFDDLARLAARTCGVPIALISFVAAERVWLKAHLGVTTTEVPRSDSLCAQAILSPHRFHISDLLADPRYARHPAVTGPEGLRFYAGAPLIAPGGFAVGVLCALDHQPRTLTADQLEALETIARQVITQLELRRNLRRLERSLADHERTEAALRRAEARYRSIFENVAEGIFQTTAEGQYVAANPMLARIYGYDSPAELQAAVRNIRGQLYVDPERRAEFTRRMREHGEVHHFESQIRRKDGSQIWISENARSVTDADGRFLYYEGTVEDISDRRQAEEALRNSELLYHSLVDALPQNIFRKDTEGRFTFVNQLFCQTLKRPAPAILGQTDAAFFPPELAAKYRADDQWVMSGQQTLEKTEEHVKPDGTKLYVHVIKTPLKDSAGNVIGVQGIFWDETERHRIEAALEYERDLLRALLDHIPDAVYFKDLRSKFIRASRALARRFGLNEPERLTGKSDFDFFTVEHAQPAFEDEQRIIATGLSIADVTEKETWPDGRVTWVRTSKVPLRDRAGRIIGTFGISKDVTDLIRVEQELEQARDAALDVARLKAEILANMSHEIRTPMNAIIGTTDLLRRSPLTPEQREFADQIHHGAETLLSIINGILDLSRLESGHLTLEHIEFDLRDTIESAVELLAETAHIKGLDLVCWIEPEAPPIVRGDPVRLRQILNNLVGNAIKFTRRGEVNVRVGLASLTGSAIALRFEVQDTGVGIAPKDRQRIFEPFRQADGSTTRQHGGTGLGLAIARQLVGLMDGQLEVASEPDVGSTFSFTVPFELPPGPAAPPPAEPATPLLGLRVLVVDDHAGSRRVLLQTLRRWGVVADESEDAEDALRRLREAAARGKPFEVVLMDFSLNEVTGLELATAIKGMPGLPPPRVLLLTSLSTWLDAEALQTHGITACLLKPPRQTRLFASLVNVHTADPSGSRAPSLPPPTPASPDRALRVLIAEDNEFNRRLALRQLASLGHQARTAAHGNEVLKLLEQEPADVLLLDCQMPELDGYQTARAIRQREAAAPPADRRPLHIIALTANALPGQREKCLAAGMDDFLTKPVRVADLEAALRRAHQALAGPIAPGQEPASPVEPALDPTVIQALAGDPEGRQELGELFLATVHSQLDRLTAAARNSDAADLQAAAHSIKGSAVNFGARRLGRLAAELEGRAKLRQLDTAAQQVQELQTEFDRVRAAWDALPPAAPALP